MSILDSLKRLFGKKDELIGKLPEDLNSVDEIKTKIQGNVSEETVNKITDAIPGDIDDKIADKVFDNQPKQ